MADSPPLALPNLDIPVDLFASKKHLGLAPEELGFADPFGNLVFIVRKISSTVKTVLDSSRNPLVSIHRYANGAWEVLNGEGGSEKELNLRVRRTCNKFTATELEVEVVGQNQTLASNSPLKVRGSPFMKSSTIYRGDTILAQTSLMYKLKQLYVRRNKFRLTVFPGFATDRINLVALVVIFLEGRK